MNSMMTILAGQFVVSYATIFLRGVQTQNVVHGDYKQAALTSCLMSVCNVTFIGMVVANPWLSLAPSAAGGALGVVSAMYLKRRNKK